MQREITAHNDGYGLNEALRLTCDERDPSAGNASHTYFGDMENPTLAPDGGKCMEVLHIQFQHGPRDVEGSVPGVTDVAVLQVIIDRYEGFQAGPFACRENQQVLDALLTAKAHMVMRANTRAVQKVLGKNEQHRS